MPTTSRTHRQPSRRDSWPPTQIPLYRSIEADDTDTPMDVDHHRSLIDDDPMNSFLTPTPLLDDGDTDDEDVMDMDLEMTMAFDAGIEDPHRPIPTIRSISPSTLGAGLRAPPPRTPTPPHLRHGSRSPPSRNSPEVSTPNTDLSLDDDDDDDDDDDGEDYVRFTTAGSLSPSPPPFRLSVPAFNNLGSSKSRGGKARRAGKAAAVAAARAQEKQQDRVALMMARGSSFADDEGAAYPSPGSPAFHVGRPPTAAGAARGRPTTSSRPQLSQLSARPRSWSGPGGYGSGRLSPRAWREPSPDVWSIEEDAEGEELSEMELDTQVRGAEKGKGKRVRFALPVREEIP